MEQDPQQEIPVSLPALQRLPAPSFSFLTLQAARSPMRRPHKSISPAKEGGKSQQERQGNPPWSLDALGKAHLGGGAMRGSPPESVPWHGSVDIQRETPFEGWDLQASPGGASGSSDFSGNAGNCRSKAALDPTCSRLGAGELSQPKTTGTASPKTTFPKNGFNRTQTAAPR